MKNIFTILLFCVASFGLHGQIIYDATCFESDFSTNEMPNGVNVEVESGNYEIKDGFLTGTYTNISNWKCVLKINYTTPLDLTDNATLIIKALSSDLSSNPEIRIRLFSVGGGGTSDYWDARFRINNNGTLAIKEIDFSGNEFKGNLDFSKVNCLEFMVSDGGPASGSINFDYIKLGLKKEPAKEYYIDDFIESGLSDSNVSFIVDGGAGYELKNGGLIFNIKANPGWGQVFEFEFNNPIDISNDPTLDLSYTKEGDGAFQVRLIDALGNSTGDDNDAVFWGSGIKNFFSKSASVNMEKIKYIKFYDKGLTGGSKVILEKIRIGKDPGSSSIVKQQTEGTFRIYPSITSDYIHIVTSENVYRLSIYNMSGTKIKTIYNTSNIDVSSFPQGIYFIRLNEGKSIKFIKQ